MSNPPAENRWRTSNSQQQPKGRDRASIYAQPPPQQPPPTQRPRNLSSSDASTGTSPAVVAKASSGAGTTKSPVPQQQQATPPPNPWTNAAAAERSRSASAARVGPAASGTNNGVKSKTSSATASVDGSREADVYVPVGGFNGDELRSFMRRCHQEAVAGDSGRVGKWKDPADTTGVKQGGPWGQKPTLMSNGSDFWVLLKKQVIAKEQGIGG